MRLLLYEFLSAGGMADAPPSLVREGWAMLAAVVADAAGLPDVQARALVRDGLPSLPIPCRRLSGASEAGVFREEIARCDAALVIAPEFDGILAARSRWVVDQGKRLLGLAPAAIDLAADKLACASWWQTRGVPTLPTVEVRDGWTPSTFPVVLKPRYGAGCLATFVVHDCRQWPPVLARARSEAPDQPLLVQPYVRGRDASAAFLLGGGKAMPLRAGRQDIVAAAERLAYGGGSLPLPADLETRALALAERAVVPLAAAFPDSAGFVGVDLLLGEDERGDVVVEINPRLTTSYVGLRRLTRDNLLLKVLELREGRPVEPPRWRSGTVRFTPDGEIAS